MIRCTAIGLVVSTAALAACARMAGLPERVVCSEAWYRMVDEKLQTGDGQGHGPDVGSDEWKSVVEFKLGMRGKPEVPNREGDAWCRYIDDAMVDD